MATDLEQAMYDVLVNVGIEAPRALSAELWARLENVLERFEEVNPRMR
jgi:hypothetical protein